MLPKIRLRQQPVNRMFLGAGSFGALAWWLWTLPQDFWQTGSIGWMSGLLALTMAGRGTIALIASYRLRRNLAIAQEVTQDHGSARQASWAEAVAAGMTDPENGNFLGLYENTAPVFAPPDTPFTLVEMPPGAGKTVSCVVGSILHRAQLGDSLVIPDPKLELGVMLGPKLKAMGFEVWFANPTHGFAELCGDVEINPYQSLLDAVYADGDARKDATKFAADYAELHCPTSKEEKNPYFGYGSRRSLATASLLLALTDPGHCTPTDTFRMLADPRRFIKALTHARDALEGPRVGDPLIDFIKGEAANLIDRAEKNEENFGAFLEGATQRLLPFNQAGRLGGYGRTAIRNVAELRERQVILFIMTPLSHMRDLSSFTSALNLIIIEACKNNPGGYPIHIVGEEALNYQFINLVSDLETMRGLGVTADFYIQSFHGLVRRYGRESALAIEAYADIKMYAGLNAFDRAKFVSDMLAEETIRKQDYSYQAVIDQLGVSSKEMSRRLMMPNEVLAMPRNLAWTFVRGMNPMLLQLCHYGQVAPWRDQVSANPLEGAPLRADPRFTLHYPTQEVPHD